jgi:hypothetical protein
MATIEFFYWPECPSHERALAILFEVMAEEHIRGPVEIIRVNNESDAERYQFHGSPTIRVDGRDIAPLPEEDTQPSLTCRAYRRPDGRISPLPPRGLMSEALQRSSLLEDLHTTQS